MAILHPAQRVAALVPKYVERFECIGPACSDTCCAGWSVTIDKKTFNAYKQVSLPGLKPRLKSQLHRVRQNSSDANYGKIELNPENKACPFIEEHLCAIQRDLGAGMLSNTCANYPRHNSTISGVTQQALTLSCPEAARLALLAEDAFEFTEAELLIRSETITKINGKYGFTAEQINEARFFALRLIRTPSLDLWQRLAVLGVYCEQLDELIKNKQTDKLADVMAMMQGAMDSGQITDSLSELLPDHGVQAVLFANIWKIKKGGLSAAQQRQLNFTLQGLGVSSESDEISLDELTQRYTQGVEKLHRVLQRTPHLLTNYVANELLREHFPFGTTSPLHHYLRLMTRYGVIRWMLAMRCMASTDLPAPEDLVETVQVFCKRYQHDINFANQIDEAFQKAGWSQMAKIYRFLRT